MKEIKENTLKKLEKELKKLEIRYEYASEKDLPYSYYPYKKDKELKNVLKIKIYELTKFKEYLTNEIKSRKKEIELIKLELNNKVQADNSIENKKFTLNNFELFEKIITGDLRPHRYESDGKLLEKRINEIEITDKDISRYVKYLDRKGESYTIKIVEHDTGKILLDENRNDEFNELIDIDIPPVSDKKGELYLELIEFEYARSIENINKYIQENEPKEIEEYEIKNLQHLRNIWQDLKLYRKLIIKEKGLDYKKSNDYVILVLETYIERTVVHLLTEIEPYVDKEYLNTVNEEIFGEKQRRLIEIEREFSKKIKRKCTDADKRFDAVFDTLTMAKTIEEKIYNEIKFWKDHRYEKIEGIGEEEKEFISKSMVENFESELDKARATGWIRGHKIELDKADRLHKYMMEILKEYEKAKKVELIIDYTHKTLEPGGTLGNRIDEKGRELKSKEMLDEFDKYKFYEDYIKIEEQLIKLKDDKSRYRYLIWIEKTINEIISAIEKTKFFVLGENVITQYLDPYLDQYLKDIIKR